MDKEGIVCARRKGEWRIWTDVKTFKNSIGDVMEDYSIGAGPTCLVCFLI